MPTIFSSFCGFLDEARAEHVLVGGGVRLGLRLRAGGDVELDHRVIFVGGSFRRTVALALLRHDVDQDRAGLHVADVLQNGEQMVEIMAVDRADIIEAELLEQRAAVHHEAAGIFLDAVGAVGDDFRQTLVDLLGRLAQRAIGLAGIEPRQIRAHRADRRGNRHVVVVEDHDQPRIHRAGIVHGLIGHAGTTSRRRRSRRSRCSCRRRGRGRRPCRGRPKSRSRNARRRTDRNRSRCAW